MPLSDKLIQEALNEVNAERATQSASTPISRQPIDYGEFAAESAKQIALGAIQTGARTLRNLPAVVSSWEQDPTKTTAIEKLFIEAPAKSQERYLEKYAQEGMPTKDFANAAASIGYSGATAGLGFAAERIASIPSGGLPSPLSTGAMGLMAGLTAYGATRDQKLEELYNIANEASIRERKIPITKDEWVAIRDANDYRNKAAKYGMYEAIPEAIGDVLGYRIIAKGVPFGKAAVGAIAKRVGGEAAKDAVVGFGGTLAGKIVGRAAATQLTEQATELYTGVKQAQIDSELYGTEPMTTGEVFSQQWKPVAITTMALGGMGGAAAKGVDLMQTHNLRKNFDYNDVTQRKKAVNNLYLALMGVRVKVDADGKVVERVAAKPIDIEEARKIQRMYGEKQNPEMYRRMGEIIDTIEDMRKANAKGDANTEANDAVILDVLMTDNTEEDTANLVAKVIQTEGKHGKAAAREQAATFAELASVRKDIPDVVDAMNKYLRESIPVVPGGYSMAERQRAFDIAQDTAEEEQIFATSEEETARRIAGTPYSPPMQPMINVTTPSTIAKDLAVEWDIPVEDVQRVIDISRGEEVAKPTQTPLQPVSFTPVIPQQGVQTKMEIPVEKRESVAPVEQAPVSKPTKPSKKVQPNLMVEEKGTVTQPVEQAPTEQPIIEEPVVAEKPERGKKAKPARTMEEVSKRLDELKVKKDFIEKRVRDLHKVGGMAKVRSTYNTDSLIDEYARMYAEKEFGKPVTPKKRKQKAQEASQSISTKIEEAITPTEQPTEQPTVQPTLTPEEQDMVEEQEYEDMVADEEPVEQYKRKPEKEFTKGDTVVYKQQGKKGKEIIGVVTKPIIQRGEVVGYKVKDATGNDRILMLSAGYITNTTSKIQEAVSEEEAEVTESPTEEPIEEYIDIVEETPINEEQPTEPTETTPAPQEQGVETFVQDGVKYTVISKDKISHADPTKVKKNARSLWYKVRDENGGLWLRSTGKKSTLGGKYQLIQITPEELEQINVKSKGGVKSTKTKANRVGGFIPEGDLYRIGPAFSAIVHAIQNQFFSSVTGMHPEIRNFLDKVTTGKSSQNAQPLEGKSISVNEEDVVNNYVNFMVSRGDMAGEGEAITGREGEAANLTLSDVLDIAGEEWNNYLAGNKQLSPEEARLAAEEDIIKGALGLTDEEYAEIQALPKKERNQVIRILGLIDERELISEEEAWDLHNSPWREKVAELKSREEEMGINHPFNDDMSFFDIDDDIRMARTSKNKITRIPLNVESIHNTVNNTTSKFKNSPSIRVVESIEELSDDERAILEKSNDKYETLGFYKNSTNTITLIAPNIYNENDVIRTVLHESIGHYGLRGVLGNELNNVLDSVYNYYMSAKKEDIQDVADKYEITMEDLEAPWNRRIVAEELVARMAEDPTISHPLWQRILRTITNALLRITGAKRKALNAKGITITSEEDIRALIKASRDFVSESLSIRTMPENTNGFSNAILEGINIGAITQANMDIMAKKEGIEKVIDANPNSEKNMASSFIDAMKDMYLANEESDAPNKELTDANNRIKQLDWYFDNKLLDDTVAIANAILAKNRGDIGQPADIKWERFFKSPEFWEAKVPAYKNIFKAIDNVKIDQHQLLSDILEKNPDTGNNLLTSLGNFAKANPLEFEKLGKIIVENDRNEIEYARDERLRIEEIVAREDELEDVTEDIAETEARWKERAELRAEREKLQEQYVEKVTAALKKEGLSDEGVQAWFNERAILDNTLDKLIETGKVIIADYEKLSGKELTDIRDLVKSMGQLKGWYYPRVRKPGQYALYSEKTSKETGKKVTNSDLKFFTNKVAREKYAIEQRKNGFKVRYYNTSALPSDMVSYYDAGVNLEAMLNDVVQKITMEPVASLDDITGVDYYTVDYVKKDGTKQPHLIVEVTDPLYAEPVKSGMRKDVKGDGKYAIQRNGENQNREAYHFVIQDGQTEEDVKAHVLESINKQAEAYLAMKDRFSADILNSIIQSMKIGGLRASTKQRKQTTGEEVTTGYDEDVLSAINQYIMRTTAGIAKSKMANDAVAALHGHINLDGSRVKRESYESSAAYYDAIKKNRIDKQNQSYVYEAALRQIEDNLRPSDMLDRITGIAKAIAVLKFLAGPTVWASPFINLTTLATSVPASMHYYAGVPMKAVPRMLGKASKDYVLFRNALRKGESIRDLEKKGVHPATIQFMEEIVRGDLDRAQFFNDIVTGAQGKLGAFMNKFMNSWFGMKIFEETERLNRGATMIAAFNYLVEKNNIKGNMNTESKEFKQMEEMALKVSGKAHGLYGKSATPYWGQGKGVAARSAKSIYTFMKFPHTYLENIYDLLGESKNDPQARRAATYMILAPVILGGMGAEAVSGVVFGVDKAIGQVVGAEPLMNLVKAVTGDDDPEESFYELVEDMFGQTAKTFAQEGLFGTISPVSIRRSLAIELPSIQQNVPVSLYNDFKGGISALFQGDLYRGVEKLSPRFIASPVRAYREYTQGATTKGGQPIWYGKDIIKPTTGEFLGQFVGFTPATTSRQKEEVFKLKQISEQYREQRTEIYGKLRRLIVESDGNPKQRDINKLKKEIVEFNKKVIKKRKEDPLYLSISIISSREIQDAIKSMSEPSKLEKARYVKMISRGEI